MMVFLWETVMKSKMLLLVKWSQVEVFHRLLLASELVEGAPALAWQAKQVAAVAESSRVDHL